MLYDVAFVLRSNKDQYTMKDISHYIFILNHFNSDIYALQKENKFVSTTYNLT